MSRPAVHRPSVTVVLSLVAAAAACWPAVTARPGADDGALYLTPMMRSGRTDAARAASRVRLAGAAEVESYAGYLTVDDERDSNLFFWFFPAQPQATGARAPVVLWLQGGPGVSSLYSVFNEHGPFSVHANGTLEPRPHAWTSTHSMLYVDSPVGAGYSFTCHESGYSRNQTAVGQNLYAALVQFFELFPEHHDSDFYAAGESYAGKYVPAVAYAIHLNNPNATVKINFKGLAIGNGLIDPGNQMVYSEFLYQHGLVDEAGRQMFEILEDLARDRIAAGDFDAAFRAMTSMMITVPSLYTNLTGMSNIYNVASNSNPIPFVGGTWDAYVQRPAVRAALHVGLRPWSDTRAVYDRLEHDIPRSVAPWLAALLDAGRYRVLLYSGHLDVIVPYPGTVNVARALQWSGAGPFRNATRTVWRVQPEAPVGQRARDVPAYDGVRVAGYATTHGPLTLLMVRNAGHMVPYDQPAWAHDLIQRFTSGTPFQ